MDQNRLIASGGCGPLERGASKAHITSLLFGWHCPACSACYRLTLLAQLRAKWTEQTGGTCGMRSPQAIARIAATESSCSASKSPTYKAVGV